MQHKFTCTECPTTPFFTTFAPKFDSSFCPNCGQDKTVTYHGEVNHTERFEAVNTLLRKLYDIRKSSIKYALSDLSYWLEYDMDRLLSMMDELQYDVENGEAYELSGTSEKVEA